MTARTYEHTHSANLDAVRASNSNHTNSVPSSAARASSWIGRSMSGLVIAFLVFGSVLPKVLMPELANESMHQLGFPAHHLLVLAGIELLGVVLYAFRRTAMLGAIWLTGLLGGAIASHLRIGAPVASHTLFPVYVGLLMWGGLWFRNARIQRLLPFVARD